MSSYLLLVCAAFAAGIINSVAGGGSFLTFPALVFTGVPSIIANASNTVALLPGIYASTWAYHQDFQELENFPFRPMMAANFAGGAAGALLLLFTPQRTFDSAIPWLMLTASVLFAFGPRLGTALKRRVHIGAATLVSLQFLIAVYGGYFGGAIGIMMLAAWSVYGLSDVRALSFHRTFSAGIINTVAVVCFIAARKVWWPQTLAMLVAAMIGGYAGAHTARRVNSRGLRAVVMVISFVITAAFFLRHT